MRQPEVERDASGLDDAFDLDQLLLEAPADGAARQQHVGRVGREWDGIERPVEHEQVVDSGRRGLVAHELAQPCDRLDRVDMPSPAGRSEGDLAAAGAGVDHRLPVEVYEVDDDSEVPVVRRQRVEQLGRRVVDEQVADLPQEVLLGLHDVGAACWRMLGEHAGKVIRDGWVSDLQEGVHFRMRMEHLGQLLVRCSRGELCDLVGLEREEVSHLEFERGEEGSEMVGVGHGIGPRGTCCQDTSSVLDGSGQGLHGLSVHMWRSARPR